LGGGCELAMACTFRVVSENAQFGLPELGLGVIPGYGGTQRLARIIGKSRALWMMLTGEMMGAEEALDTGLANKVVKSDELMEAVFKVAKTIC
ncbi:MAG: enoyl-CoA hydratase, partial [Deltaproteobacteria bacterium CG_4_9_14_3_um_filter_65_9]